MATKLYDGNLASGMTDSDLQNPFGLESVRPSFSVGEQVIIRYGRQQGQKGTIIKSQRAEVYEVKAEDGGTLFFSGKGLEREKERTRHPG